MGPKEGRTGFILETILGPSGTPFSQVQFKLTLDHFYLTLLPTNEEQADFSEAKKLRGESHWEVKKGSLIIEKIILKMSRGVVGLGEMRPEVAGRTAGATAEMLENANGTWFLKFKIKR